MDGLGFSVRFVIAASPIPSYGLSFFCITRAMSDGETSVATEEEEGWRRYYDEEEGAYYWHHEESGESRWEELEEEKGAAEIWKETTSREEGDEIIQQKEVIKEDIKNDKKKTKEKHKRKHRKKKKSNNKKEYYDDEYIDLLREEEVISRTQSDINRYRACFFLNLVVFEYPIVVIEGCVRFALILIILLLNLSIATIVSCIAPKIAKYFLSLVSMAFRESILTAAATLTLSVPFAILLVYRDFDAENVWDLSPIPTCIGKVDCRRFLTITVGHGSGADNVDIDISKSKFKSFDSWGNGSAELVFMFPRAMLTNIKY